MKGRRVVVGLGLMRFLCFLFEGWMGSLDRIRYPILAFLEGNLENQYYE